MPRIVANNQYWLRGGRLNQKRHIDMSEEEKAKVARCPGTKDNHPCKNPIYRCSECGNYGCAQEVANKCSDQGFKNDKCLNCGVTGTRIPIMEGEFAKFIEAWENNNY